MPPLLLPILLSPALDAQEPASGPGDGSEDLAQIESVSRIEMRFPITSCTRFKSVAYDRRDPATTTSATLFVVLVNQTDETCWWDGVSLQGTLEGTYTPSPLPPHGLGLMLESGGELKLKLKPTSGAGVRPVVELFIPPDQSVVILRALPDAEPPPLDTDPVQEAQESASESKSRRARR